MTDMNEERDVSQIIDDYSGKTDDELINTIRDAVASQKQDGTFDAESLEMFCQTIMPMMSDAQRQKLSTILLALK